MRQSIANSTYPRESFWETDPSPYTGKPWGTRDLEAKSWQIAASVKVGPDVFYCVRIICFSLQVSLEQWVNSGCFLWEGKWSVWQSPAQWDVFRRFPTIDIPSAQHPAQCTQAVGFASLPTYHQSSAVLPQRMGHIVLVDTHFGQCSTGKCDDCASTEASSGDSFTQNGQLEQLLWCILFSRGIRRPCSISLFPRDQLTHHGISTLMQNCKDKAFVCSILFHFQSNYS